MSTLCWATLLLILTLLTTEVLKLVPPFPFWHFRLFPELFSKIMFPISLIFPLSIFFFSWVKYFLFQAICFLSQMKLSWFEFISKKVKSVLECFVVFAASSKLFVWWLIIFFLLSPLFITLRVGINVVLRLFDYFIYWLFHVKFYLFIFCIPAIILLLLKF